LQRFETQSPSGDSHLIGFEENTMPKVKENFMPEDFQASDANPSAESKTSEQDPLTTILPKHLELFAQCIADGYTVRDAAKQSGRAEGSGGYLSNRPEVKRRVAELRTAMAKAAEGAAATKTYDMYCKIDVSRNLIIMGLVDIARNGTSESARVSAWNHLAEIYMMKAKSLHDVENFRGWTDDELLDYADSSEIPERLRNLVRPDFELRNGEKKKKT
jgi:hypothetical protein